MTHAVTAEFGGPDAFRDYLRRLPPGFAFAAETPLVSCPLACWARTVDDRALVSGTQVAWEGSFAGPGVRRLTWWQESFSRLATLHALAVGPLPAATALAMLDTVLRPGAVRIGRPLAAPASRVTTAR